MRRPFIALAVLLLSLFTADAARAEGSAGRCEGRVIEQPFAAWDDTADYFLAPDGDFSSGAAGWDLAGASVVEDNEPWYVHGPAVPAAVGLPEGASATSPTICVAETDPTMRFFARGAGALQVDVLYTDGDGVEQALPIGVVDAATDWAPAPALPITANTYRRVPVHRAERRLGDRRRLHRPLPPGPRRALAREVADDLDRRAVPPACGRHVRAQGGLDVRLAAVGRDLGDRQAGLRGGDLERVRVVERLAGRRQGLQCAQERLLAVRPAEAGGDHRAARVDRRVAPRLVRPRPQPPLAQHDHPHLPRDPVAVR
jgi:hypothetical protein